MTALVLLVIVVSCVVYQYLKGSLLGAVVSIITTICSGFIAFAYFESVALLLVPNVGRTLVPWTYSLCFMLLFIIAFAVLQTIASKLIRKSVTFEPVPERVGRCLCGALCGFILTGLLFTLLAATPLSKKLPYQRFGSTPDPKNPNKAVLNPDGFFCGLFGLASRGGMSGKTSFDVIHPSFIDEMFINRYITGRSTTLLTKKNVISLPAKAAWPAPDTLRSKNGTNVTPATGHSLTVVRIGIKPDGKYFTAAQLRLVCKEKTDSDNSLQGKAVNSYPLGYISSKDRLETKQLDELIAPKFSGSTVTEKLVDFVFEVPDDYYPLLVVFKQSSIARVPKLISTDQAPEHVPF